MSRRNLTRDLFSSRPRGPHELLPEVFAGLCKMSSVALRHGVAQATPAMGRPLAHVARVSACEVPIPEPPFPRTSAARLLSRACGSQHARPCPSISLSGSQVTFAVATSHPPDGGGSSEPMASPPARAPGLPEVGAFHLVGRA